MLDMTGKVAIVTGGGGDIGRTTAVTLVKQGAKVLLVDLNEDALAASADAVRNAGGTVETFAADVSDPAQAEAYAQKAVDAFGKIDLFFNNAGIEGPAAPIVDYPVDAFDKVWSVNVRGVFLGLKAVLPKMTQGALWSTRQAWRASSDRQAWWATSRRSTR